MPVSKMSRRPAITSYLTVITETSGFLNILLFGLGEDHRKRILAGI